MLADVQMNFFGVTTISTFSFYLLVGIFITFSIKQKSPAAFHLGIAFLVSSMLAFPYIISSIWYHPHAAFHRWVTVVAAAVNMLHFSMFIWNFPRPRWKLLSRIIMGSFYFLIILASIYFYKESFQSGYVFKFAGHYYDFKADGPSKVIAGLILLITLNLLVGGIAQTIASRKSERWAALAITLILFLSLMIPGITNALSRDGLITRGFHQTTILYATVTGFFLTLVIFINTTKDKTNFMARIVGVCLVTVLVMSVMIFYNVFEDKEEAYDQIKNETTRRIVDHVLFKPGIQYLAQTPDLDYLIHVPGCSTASSKHAALKFFYRSKMAASVLPDVTGLISEYENSCLLARLQRVGDDQTIDQVRRVKKMQAILLDTPPDFAGYAGLINRYLLSDGDPAKLSKYLAGRERQILYRYNKLRTIPDANFRVDSLKLIKGIAGDLAPFGKALVGAHRAIDETVPTDQMRNQLLAYLQPMQAISTRRYRRGGLRNHFIAYQYYDHSSHQLYEAGYAYRAYREFMHPQGMRMMYIVLAFIAVIVFGFRLFFLGTLINPLNRLLESVRAVNKGDLSVNVPVEVEDEIGFLSRSFNGMVRSIRTAREKLQEHADDLEIKVQERTAELQETLQTVQQLKTNQDGDYFLTAMIIKPLSANNVNSETINVEFLLDQKKKFEFRKWKEEIGGDICSAHSIRLKDRPYTVFLNADAMGKSMQGAGGALVLGAVFESIIERTKLSRVTQDQFPERWLKNAFVELQKVFESFDGTMLVSAAMGVLDDSTGVLYYINAEHPWTVLYRKGEASFIENELAYRKLGMPSLDSKISIQTLQLKAGDVLIAGSDGRDDILLGRDEKGGRIINEDEQLFLPAVEEGHGDLEQIRKVLARRGEFTDDLSLIRIGYMEDIPQISTEQPGLDVVLKKVQKLALAEEYEQAEEVLQTARNENPGHIKILKALIRLYMKLKRYKVAAPLVQEYIVQHPYDTEMIYFASVIARKLGSALESIDLGERVRLRNPGMVRNLLNLAGAYAQTKNQNRAIKILDEAESVEPGDERILSLRQKIMAE